MTPVSDTVFYALAHGTLGLALHSSSFNPFLIGGNYTTQEAMENFVFPYEIKTKLLMKMYELMNIFFYFDWNSTKKAAKGYFLFSLEKQAKRPLRFALPLEGKCINKKTQHVDLLTYAY